MSVTHCDKCRTRWVQGPENGDLALVECPNCGALGPHWSQVKAFRQECEHVWVLTGHEYMECYKCGSRKCGDEYVLTKSLHSLAQAMRCDQECDAAADLIDDAADASEQLQAMVNDRQLRLNIAEVRLNEAMDAARSLYHTLREEGYSMGDQLTLWPWLEDDEEAGKNGTNSES